MIVQEMNFEGEDYSKVVALRNEIRTNGEPHKFYRYMHETDDRSQNPEMTHTSYPHMDEKRYWEKTLVTLYLWEKERKGQVSFITPSPEAFQNALQAVRGLIRDPTRETKSGLTVIVTVA